MRRQRLDAELVRRKLAVSRNQATQLIAQGRVTVGGQVVSKPASQVDLACGITVKQLAEGPDYVSRGGRKLAGALDQLADHAPKLDGRIALDAGASTGGFTDVLLRRGVRRVFAVDVGYGQLAWSLRQDQRVTVMERINVRHLTLEALDEVPEVVVGDLSFISLTTVLPVLSRLAPGASADFFLLVKPQFEVGRQALPAGGVVRDPQHWRMAIVKVVDCAEQLGLAPQAVVRSPLPGPSGNIEFFVHLKRGTGLDATALTLAVAQAIGDTHSQTSRL
ncbi:MAG: TlyA family RNA methyltransferase [Bifidobacteriaceae bacterium]|jgi:23S rRNA (cytidine1920-2'-O)/16S rRNA (cytidine1409-2'-O)-methyltransferase|nr:TlyA family RNA methyltransferase [Bifidobacteriaceae bacterium]